MWRAVARAILSPQCRATTRKAMSMPAEMPAEVKTFSSSTTCRSRTTVMDGKDSARRSSELEDFHVRKDQDADLLPFHGCHSFLIRTGSGRRHNRSRSSRGRTIARRAARVEHDLPAAISQIERLALPNSAPFEEFGARL